jgi:hypothetical protein
MKHLKNFENFNERLFHNSNNTQLTKLYHGSKNLFYKFDTNSKRNNTVMRKYLKFGVNLTPNFKLAKYFAMGDVNDNTKTFIYECSIDGDYNNYINTKNGIDLNMLKKLSKSYDINFIGKIKMFFRGIEDSLIRVFQINKTLQKKLENNGIYGIISIINDIDYYLVFNDDKVRIHKIYCYDGEELIDTINT